MASLVVLLVLLMTMLSGGAMAQLGCTSAIMGLAPCLTYISGSSSKPSTSCCSQLTSVVQTQPKCLCQVLNGGGSSYGVSINKTQALALPNACNVQTPPASQCNAVNQPSESPVESPLGSPTNSSADAVTQPSESPVGSPVGSPTNSPADASAPEGSITPDDLTPPTVSSIPSTGTGSKSTTGSTSDANLNKFSLHSTLLLLIITLSASAVIAN